ncbi:hypothetical protein N7478_011583 [Penicillium angulare]|uniref:uncharacterized protein n=1 Tax=Penicillium angulare TaxID=116970 RepID=UPI00253FBCAD|nr:uncharacterized protein N7478_011583 [Penicillium angulare]KAJ5260988.1 hypothetical protein N7478_011583 [Penicillium angulare]
MVQSQPEPIAIVGSGCRFPGSSSSPSALWKLLQKPRDVSKEPPNERFELKGYYLPKGTHHGTTNVQRAYMLDEDVGAFDATFFNISPNEAESIDPQQRLLMGVVYEALESGGHRIDTLRGSDTAVYVGTMSVDYSDIILRDINSMPTYFSTGTSRAILANPWLRCTKVFNHFGQEESRVAIAGGTELLLGPEQFVGESKMNLLSPTGQSRMWDASANGYARADGIAAVVLKRLSDAIADGDHIECLIRQTGINQDGKSTGLTVPSSEAQADLIKSTYTKAGLDIKDPRDWPQFFEAHGTGTKAGDPREASAINQCLGRQPIHGNPLYVGSVKTIIGHTEGTAGLAGVLKASQAIQNGFIPLNMLLNQMNEEVAQHCSNLCVPNSLIPWPKLPDGVPRRASINSFGFGGTNGHAIVEQYKPFTKIANNLDRKSIFKTFPFSASSEWSLNANLDAYASYLKAGEHINLDDLAWTLQSRRSILPFTKTFSANSIQDLVSKIEDSLAQAKANPGSPIGTRSGSAGPKIIGVFTGQGAQWAEMAAHLILTSETVRQTIRDLDASLATLPEADRPAWRIGDQLCADASSSRLNEAALSQPLCTAIQVVLVDLLRSAGITFQAVVGHSSGEIAAAYAADFISAHDAIRIAYYRGLRRVKIAAQNSAASLTLSGDTDAISHAKRVFEEEKKFTRLLVVDTAYHSHHMLQCNERYIRSLQTCGIQINYSRTTSCTWYSSVKHGERMEPNNSLGDTYWNDNMVNTVLFADAVKGAANANKLNLALEVGHHPALRGPAVQTLSDLQISLPYSGALKRKANDLEAFQDALGFIWTHLGPSAVDFQTCEKLMYPGSEAPSLVINLPIYQWDHSRAYWYQSRLSKKIETRGHAFHELLGVPSPNNTDRDLRWTNFLKSNEIPWLDGHQLQGQTVFPAAGYVAMAFEAALKLAQGNNVKVLQIENLTIDKAVTFDDGPSFAVETLVTLTGIMGEQFPGKKHTADFSVYSCPNTGTVEMDLVSQGHVTVVYGEPSFSNLSSKPLSENNMTDIDAEEFYASLYQLGYGYNGPFKTLKSTKRRLNQAFGKVSSYGYDEDDETFIVHPTMLDVAFQASFLACMSPGDQQLWSLHMPTSIQSIRVNPELCASLPSSSTDLAVYAVLHESDSLSMVSSVDVFADDGQETLIQVEGLSMKPFSPATADDDRPMFSTTVYGPMEPDVTMILDADRSLSREKEIAAVAQSLGSTVKKIIHRYPHAKILEIGSAERYAADKILEMVEGKLSSYTYTEVSIESTEKAADSVKASKQKLVFKQFDPLIKPSSQGFDENSYDVVVASNAFLDSSALQATFENIRLLLKHGGYLLASGIPTKKKDDFKQSSGRSARWLNSLRAAGFSGIDSMAPETDADGFHSFVNMSQASDNRINFLRKPLSAPLPAPLDELVIVGNHSLKSARFAEDINDMLVRFFRKITVLESLPTDDDEISSVSTFINLADIDDPIFRDVSPEKVEGLKCLFELAGSILWVTEGARADEPYHNSSIGFGRSIAYEMPHLSMQFLDLDSTDNAAPRIICEAVLRLAVLWSSEPEIYVEKGDLTIPRLLPQADQNARINSLRRAVTKKVDPTSCSVLVSQGVEESSILLEQSILPVSRADESIVRAMYSILAAIRVTPEISLFLGAGVEEDSGALMITLSEENSSIFRPLVRVAAEWQKECLSTLLSAVARRLIARALLSAIPGNSHLLIHGLDENEPFGCVLTQHAAVSKVDIKFTNADATEKPGWTRIAPWASRHVARKAISPHTTHFLDLSSDVENQEACSVIHGSLPPNCRTLTASALFKHEGLLLGGDRENLLRILENAVQDAKEYASSEIPGPSIRLTELSDELMVKSPVSVIDWTLDKTISVLVRPINAAQLFFGDKTYVLVGLSGELGRSISQWMSLNGAGSICLISRNPKLDPEWQAEMEGHGTTVRFISMDVTRKEDVERVFSDLRANYPPIAGVANGAALFHDAPFSEMTHEILDKVMKPKVLGTKNLDEVLGDTDLDFFIVFSSLTSVLGNSGQCNYTAANAYMTGLVGQRQKRGLAATSLDIGSIIGLGIMDRAGESAREQLIRYGFMAISQADLHQLLAEAIHAGRPKSGRNPVVTTGCRTVQEEEEPPVMWIEDPRLQHKVIWGSNSANTDPNNKRSPLPVHDQLAEAASLADGLEILKESFSAKVAMISRLAGGQVGHDIPLVELGIDSLVAVEIRGPSVTDLCQLALEKLPEGILPIFEGTGSGKPKSEEIKTKTPVSEPKSSAPVPVAQFESSRNWSTNTSASPESTSPSDGSPTSTPATALSKVTSSIDLATLADSEKPVARSPDFVKKELVSFPQSRFWFLGLLIDDQTTFNVTFYFRITGNLRVGDLERAVRLVTNRHESLRTCFVPHEKEADLAYQKVLPTSLIRLEQKKINRVEDVEIEYAAMKQVPFDLSSGNLMRLILLTLSPSEHYLLFNYHHILMDGVSLQNFLADLEKAYQRQPLSPPPCQVPEISRSQRAAFESGAFDEDIAYWKKEFPNGHPVLPLLPMSIATSRMPLDSFNVHQVDCRIGSELINKIREAARVNHATTFHFYLATFKAMLFRFTDAEDITIGIADANRISADVAGTIGLLLNLLTLQFKRDDNQSFSMGVQESRGKSLEALTHSNVPFDILLKELNVPRSSSYSPLFQCFFDYRQGHQEKWSFGSTRFEFLELHPGRTAYDMTLDITDSTDAKAGYGPHFESSWSGGTLPHRIDQIAKENADRVALKDGHGRVFTYGTMTDRIEAIAASLQENGVGQDSRVLVFEDATADWPCSMLAIMRIGAVYVPLDLRNPLSRLADVAGSCKPAAILVDSTTLEDVPHINVTSAKVINVSDIGSKSINVPNASRADAVAALLYISGSTGKPKGIVVTHAGLCNEIEGYTWRWGLSAERVLQQSAFTFNHSSDQMYTGLVHGGSVYIVPWDKRGDPIEVTKIIHEEGITYTKATPAEYSLWLDYGNENLKQASDWRFTFGGGESLTETLTKSLAKLDLPDLRFFNSYGPTEISISSTKMEVMYREPQPVGRIPCGFMLPNYSAYILDDHRKPVPLGMPGELYIGGAGVSLGYLDNQKLTDKHFMPNPYASPEYIAKGWTRMYRTGDIAHLQEDGAMVFHNRIAGDTQVKIRGLRIELGDIESNIIKSSGGALKESAVTLRGDDPPVTVAHVVFAPNHQVVDAEAFLAQLLKNLDVAVPRTLIRLPRISVPHRKGKYHRL